jgi:hypothetical protein
VTGSAELPDPAKAVHKGAEQSEGPAGFLPFSLQSEEGVALTQELLWQADEIATLDRELTATAL